jgi:hypothetical protein
LRDHAKREDTAPTLAVTELGSFRNAMGEDMEAFFVFMNALQAFFKRVLESFFIFTIWNHCHLGIVIQRIRVYALIVIDGGRNLFYREY